MMLTDDEKTLCLYALRYELQNTDSDFVAGYIMRNIAQFDSGMLKVMCSDIVYILTRRRENGTTHRHQQQWLEFEVYLQAEISRRKK